MLTAIVLVLNLLALIIISLQLRKIIMTQQEAHDAVLAKTAELKQAINDAAQRVIAAQANPEQLVPVDDIVSGLQDGINTANAIAPTPPTT